MRRTAVRPALLPVVRDKAAFADSIDVVHEGRRDDVGRQAVDHGTGLPARAAVQLPDRDVGARLGLVLARERASMSWYSSRVGSYDTFSRVTSAACDGLARRNSGNERRRQRGTGTDARFLLNIVFFRRGVWEPAGQAPARRKKTN